MMYEFDVIGAMQWVYDNKDTYNIQVVNVLLNSTVAQSYHTSPLSAAVEILWFNRIVVVISAGNNGTSDGPITPYPPANDPIVITVGTVEDKGTTGVGDDTLAVFSAYGTTDHGNQCITPSLMLASGVDGILKFFAPTFKFVSRKSRFPDRHNLSNLVS